MTLILIDGMEDVSSWTATLSQIVAGRNSNCYQPTWTQNATFLIPSADESDTLHIGFAYKTNNLDAGIICSFRSDAGATQHVTLAGNSNGSLTVARNTTTLASSAASVIAATGVWYYVEMTAVLHDSAGSFDVHVDGVSVVSGSSQDTKNGGTKTVFDSVRLIATNNMLPNFDDLYLSAGSGDSFLGDIVVETLYPNGNGNANQFVGSDSNSTDNYLLVDEVTASSSDYTGSATSTEQDMYTLTDLVRTTGTIVGVCHASYVAKSDAGAKQYKIVNRRSSDTKSAALTPSTTYINGHYVLTQDPETSAAWTISNVNSLQSGVEVV